MPLTHRVRRPWGGHHPTTAGQLVDATGYRNLAQMEKLQYIVPLTEKEAAEANAMPQPTDPLRNHVVPMPDEPRVAPAKNHVPAEPAQHPTGAEQPPPPPEDQRPAMPDREKEPGPPKDQKPANPPPPPAPPADQRPARVPNDTVSRDDAEEQRRRGQIPAQPRRRLPE